MNATSQELQDRERLLRFLDNKLSSKEVQEVESWLKTDKTARSLLAEIAEQAIVVADMARAEDAAPKVSSLTSRINLRSPRQPLWIGVAASLAIILGLSAWYLNSVSTANKNAIARLEFVSEDAEFSIDHKLPRDAGSNLGKGWVQLERGHLSIRFQSGANVELEGPVAFGIDTPMRSYLDYGLVRVHAPETARDFVVATESMEVVDLGTRFELELDGDTGKSSVSVTEGLVDLHLGSRGTARKIQPLEAGYIAQVDASGEITRLEQRYKDSSKKPTLLGHWKLEGNGSDLSDNKMNGQFNRGEDGAVVSGVAGDAVLLGQDGFIDLSEHAEQFKDTETFAFSAWVRDQSDRIAILFSLTDGTESERIQIHLNRRHLVFGWQSGLHFDSVSGKVDEWNPGQWYQVAVAVRNGMVWLYRDGKQIGSAPVGQKLGTRIPSLNAVKNPNTAFLGKLGDAADGDLVTPQWFSGMIDEVQIYSGPSTHEDIQFLFENPDRNLSQLP